MTPLVLFCENGLIWKGLHSWHRLIILNPSCLHVNQSCWQNQSGQRSGHNPQRNLVTLSEAIFSRILGLKWCNNRVVEWMACCFCCFSLCLFHCLWKLNPVFWIFASASGHMGSEEWSDGVLLFAGEPQYCSGKSYKCPNSIKQTNKQVGGSGCPMVHFPGLDHFHSTAPKCYLWSAIFALTEEPGGVKPLSSMISFLRNN